MLGLDPISPSLAVRVPGTFQARRCLSLLEDPGHTTRYSLLQPAVVGCLLSAGHQHRAVSKELP